MNSSAVIAHFESNGGRFLLPTSDFIKKAIAIKGIVFDWDGVFNNGTKNENGSSSFNEIDSMGTNLLRFSYWLNNNELPFTAILSGESNSSSFYFSQRECFHDCYFKIPNKLSAFEHFAHRYSVELDELAYFFDDVLDLPVAQKAGMRIFIARKANPLLTQFVIENKLADYITFQESGMFAVREACELIMGTIEKFNSALSERIAYSKIYQSFMHERAAIKTNFYTMVANEIVPATTIGVTKN